MSAEKPIINTWPEHERQSSVSQLNKTQGHEKRPAWREGLTERQMMMHPARMKGRRRPIFAVHRSL
jgi:hypothetical protein